MSIETLRLILLLVRSRLLKPGQVAAAAKVSRGTVYRWLVWRFKPLPPGVVDRLLDAAWVPGHDLSQPVWVSAEDIAAAARWYRLDVSESEVRAAVRGDVPGLAELFENGRLNTGR